MGSTGDKKLCKLCRTPIGGRAGATDTFCCAGCERVFDVLSRLDDGARAAYVESARKLGIIPGGPSAENAVSASEEPPIALTTDRLEVDGLVCPSCGWVVGEVLTAHKGVIGARVDYFTGTAEVTYDMAVLVK